jgi:hypothetical protein
MKNASQKLSNNILSAEFRQKLMKIEEIDPEQNTVIFRMLHI